MRQKNKYSALKLYIPIQSIYLGLGFEFGLQRIRELAIVSPYYVVHALLPCPCKLIPHLYSSAYPTKTLSSVVLQNKRIKHTYFIFTNEFD